MSNSLDDLSGRVRGALDLAQSAGDAALIIERIHPPGRGATAFSDSPWAIDRIIPDHWTGRDPNELDDVLADIRETGAAPAVHPARWNDEIGGEPVFGEPA